MENPILVTGSHRSGSTWLGKVISTSPNIFYFHEPLHKRKIPLLFKGSDPVWFPFINNENEQIYLEGYKQLLNHKFNFNYYLRKESWKFWINNFIPINYAKVTKKRFLLKDPLAIFSAEWLAKRFDAQVIVLIRHPAAFISSLKKNKWSHDFNDFLKQPKLLETYLSPFIEQIEEYAKNEKSIIEQGILLWNIIHYYIHEMKKNNPNWYFIKHETLSEKPIEEFKKIFNYLKINWYKKSEEYIIHTTSSENLSERKDDITHLLLRNSKENIYNWKIRLTKDEIKLISNKTADIATNLYSEKNLL